MARLGQAPVEFSFDEPVAIMQLFSFQLFGVKEASSLASAPKWKSPGEKELLRLNVNTVSNAAFVIRQCYALAVESIRQSLADAREAAEDITVFPFHMIFLLSLQRVISCGFQYILVWYSARKNSSLPPMAPSRRL